MATLVYTGGIPTLGATRVMSVLTVANSAAPVLTTEINAASSKEISTHLYPAGWAPTGSTAKGTQPPRLSQTTQVENFNRTTFTLADLQYAYLPQSAPTATGNEAFNMLVKNLIVYLVERIGLDAETVDWATTQNYTQEDP
jgi:hypothetical protein